MQNSRIYCNTCKNDTLHDLCCEHKQEYLDNFWGFSKLLHAQILKCRGCENLTLRLFEHPFESEDNGKTEEHLFPKREYLNRDRKYFFNLPISIKKLYIQINEAFDNNLYILAAMGLRSLLEAIIIDKISESKPTDTIKVKIDLLRKHFSNHVVETLHTFRFMGNEAIHKLKEADRLDIHRALNVIEDIMTFFYAVDYSAKTFNELKKK